MKMVSPDKAKKVLTSHIVWIDRLLTLPAFTDEFKQWNNSARTMLAQLYGENAEEIEFFESIRYSRFLTQILPVISMVRSNYEQGLTEAKQLLQAFTDDFL